MKEAGIYLLIYLVMCTGRQQIIQSHGSFIGNIAKMSVEWRGVYLALSGEWGLPAACEGKSEVSELENH